MSPNDAAFDRVLARLAAILVEHPSPVWTEWMTEAEQLRQSGDRTGAARKVLGAFGGMGSIRDSYQLLGAFPEVYAEFESLLDRAWDEARGVKRRSSLIGRLFS